MERREYHELAKFSPLVIDSSRLQGVRHRRAKTSVRLVDDQQPVGRCLVHGHPTRRVDRRDIYT